jgi:hypothetical protein
MSISKDAFEYASRLVSAKQFPADYPAADIVQEFVKTAELVEAALKQAKKQGEAEREAAKLDYLGRVKI